MGFIGKILIASGAALIAGIVDAIVGGGGVITFPTLLLLNLPAQLAVGTNKIIGISGTTMAVITFWRHRQFNPEIVSRMAPCMAIGAWAGAATVLQVPNDFLRPFAGIVLLALAIFCFFQPTFGRENRYRRLDRKLGLTLAGSCLVLGAYDGFFGPGTGVFLTFLLTRRAGLDFVRAAGNTKLLNFASNAVAVAYFAQQRNIVWSLGMPMAAANMIGGTIGARLAIRVGPRLIRWVFILMALALAVKLTLDYLS